MFIKFISGHLGPSQSSTTPCLQCKEETRDDRADEKDHVERPDDENVLQKLGEREQVTENSSTVTQHMTA